MATGDLTTTDLGRVFLGTSGAITTALTGVNLPAVTDKIEIIPCGNGEARIVKIVRSA